MTSGKEQVRLAGVKCKLELEVGMVESLGTLKAITRFNLIWRQLGTSRRTFIIMNTSATGLLE